MTRINTWALTTLDSSGDKPLGALPPISGSTADSIYTLRGRLAYVQPFNLRLFRQLVPRNHTLLSQGSSRIVLHYTNEDTALIPSQSHLSISRFFADYPPLHKRGYVACILPSRKITLALQTTTSLPIQLPALFDPPFAIRTPNYHRRRFRTRHIRNCDIDIGGKS